MKTPLLPNLTPAQNEVFRLAIEGKDQRVTIHLPRHHGKTTLRRALDRFFKNQKHERT